MHKRIALGAGLLLSFALAGCATESNDPYLRHGVRMDIVGINYVSRNVAEFWVDGNWGANLGGATTPGGRTGGNSSTCCFNLTDYTKPVKVKWIWDGVNSVPIMGPNGMFLPQTLLVAPVNKEALVMLPQRKPKIVKSDNPQERFNSEDTLCVIFRDMDTVELQYGTWGGDCRNFSKRK